jgi:N-methylhydantoinase B
VAEGDRLVFETAGAGGWGDPLLRPAERVRVDVERGFVSAEEAEEFYGVVLVPEADGYPVDDEATSSLRSARSRPKVLLFDFGPRPAG